MAELFNEASSPEDAAMVRKVTKGQPPAGKLVKRWNALLKDIIEAPQPAAGEALYEAFQKEAEVQEREAEQQGSDMDYGNNQELCVIDAQGVVVVDHREPPLYQPGQIVPEYVTSAPVVAVTPAPAPTIKPMIGALLMEELRKWDWRLAQHDWYYRESTAADIMQRGLAAERMLEEELVKLNSISPLFQRLWDAYKSSLYDASHAGGGAGLWQLREELGLAQSEAATA
jgi:hypothetical protein